MAGLSQRPFVSCSIKTRESLVSGRRYMLTKSYNHTLSSEQNETNTVYTGLFAWYADRSRESTVRLFHIMLDLLCHSLMLLNVAYYAIDPPLLFHVILSIKIKIIIIHFIKHYNNNIISLFCCIGALRTIQYSLP